MAALRSEQLGQPEVLPLAYAATVRSLTAVISTLNEHVSLLQQEVETPFWPAPDAEIILSKPGWTDSRRPGARRVRRRPRPLRQRQKAPELRRDQPAYQGLGPEEVIGVSLDGEKDILGLWAGTGGKVSSSSGWPC